MKNTLKMFGIIAIVAVIGFWSVSCGDDDGGGGNTISGNNITSGAEVVYDSSIKNITEAKNVIDYCFSLYSSDVGVEPLSKFLDGSPSVTVNNNKVTINLGIPKSAYLDTIIDLWGGEIEGVTLNPINANVFQPWGFYSSDGKYFLYCQIDDNNDVQLVYVDRNVTIKGSFTETESDYSYTYIYNVSLKKGWNYIIMSRSYNETTNTEKMTATSSTTQPSGLKWIVYEDDWGY